MDILFNIASIFLDVFLGLLPYFIGGILLSGILEVFVSSELIRKVTHHAYRAIPLMCFMGILLPVANGGSMPLASRMLKKGTPFYAVITFITAVPLLNFLTAINSSLALGWENWFFNRWLPGLVLAVVSGGVFYKYPYVSSDDSQMLDPGKDDDRSKWRHYGDTVVFDFLKWVPLFILTALLAGVLRYFLPFSTWINGESVSQSLQVLIAVFYAIIVSVSSTVDSFIIMNWIGHISIWPVIAFLLSSALLNLVSGIMALKALGTKLALYWYLWCLICIVLFVFSFQLISG